MIVKELINYLKTLPENAIVYIESDHGQTPEQAGSVSISIEEFGTDKPPYYGEDVNWDCEEFEEIEYDKKLVTAILIR